MNQYTPDEQKLLLDVATQSIEYGLKHQSIMPIELDNFPEKLHEKRASFVTLSIHNQLRGCIGSLIAYQPLVIDVVRNAYAAAFSDTRFFPLTEDEFRFIQLHISVLSVPEPMEFKSESDLIKQLRPNIDGLIISDKGYRGTFLPSVWESLPDPKQFLMHLKMKAGLPEDYWSDSIMFERYTTENIE